MKSALRNSLSIHSWGGLGSQLLALGLLLDLLTTHPNRRFTLIIHSSGVTRRVSEIENLSKLVDIVFIDDFVSAPSFSEERRSPSGLMFRRFLKWILNFSRVVISRDSPEFAIKPWTRSIRCHYGLISITRESIKTISSYIPGNYLLNDNADELLIGIHFRAGDLLKEKSSSLVNLKVISGLVMSAMKNHDGKNLRLMILSDSSIDESSIRELNGFDYTWEVKNTWDTFGSLLSTNSFIGTNSKVSLWVALFRWSLKIPGEIYLPESLHKQFKRITRTSIGELSDIRSIHY